MASMMYMVQYIPHSFDEDGPYPEESYSTLEGALKAVEDIINDGYEKDRVFLYKELRFEMKEVTETKAVLAEGQTDV